MPLIRIDQEAREALGEIKSGGYRLAWWPLSKIASKIIKDKLKELKEKRA